MTEGTKSVASFGAREEDRRMRKIRYAPLAQQYEAKNETFCNRIKAL